MSARTTRIRLFAATTAAFAALALTACGGGDDDAKNTGAGGGSPAPGASVPAAPGTGSPTAAATASGGQTSPERSAPTAKATAASTGDSASGGKPGSGGGKSTVPPAPGVDTGAVPACDGANTKTTAAVVARPLNHMLLTVTNTGSKSCDLTDGYPAARFGEAQAVPPVDRNTTPQSVLRLAPGESGYAGVRLSSAEEGSGENGYTAETLTIPFENGTIAKVSLPAEGVYVDSALQVTYWQATVDDALN
ncbi:DUF4232 domain-containing protein [Streptodolium elevatio]|uniref:DUF4232 domain-containing protein n=1 Tax=Streptodolium elevatio TaxID=3157996 RepID=A0ABV3DF98_9ACTN